MGGFRRYAVYFAPRPGDPLARFGADWLGWDPETGAGREGFRLVGLPRPRPEIVATPRKYGFHGTLKAPFRLAEGVAPEALDAAVAEVAADFAPFALPLRLSALGPFLALTPAEDSAALRRVADACVTRLDRFRAPLRPEEAAKRRAAGLGAAEEANLTAWGYPYVLDAFEFHLTLAGPLGPEDQEATKAALEAALAPILAAPMAFADLCLFGEAGDGAFHVVRRHALGAAARP